MHDPLKVVWLRADADEARIDGDEAIEYGIGIIDLLVNAGLVHRAENARCIPCDACAEHHLEEVTFVESPQGAQVRAYIYCPEHGRVFVHPERLKQWAVDFEGLAKAAAIGLELAGDIEDIIAGRLWYLGRRTIGGRTREVFLARGTTAKDAPDIFGPCERLNASSAAVLMVPGEMPSKDMWTNDSLSVIPFKLVARMEDRSLVFDQDHIEGLLAGGHRKAPVKAQKSFPTPAGTTWEDVNVWVSDHDTTIEIKRLSRVFTFQDAGFEEKRKRGVPDAKWVLLKVFAMHGGIIPFDGSELDHGTQTNLKQYVSVLRQRIRALIPGIDGDPIPYVKDERSYKMSFKITSREGLTFPVPPGIQWPDVSIALIRPDAISIAVATTERFAASTYTGGGSDADIHEWESAQKESELERNYDLRMLQLVGDDGQPDARGQALIEVLRANGAVNRSSDDEAMLELCGVLTTLMEGVDGSPFDFAFDSQKWVALFQTSCESL